jgi:hypothetical protein
MMVAWVDRIVLHDDRADDGADFSAIVAQQ